MWLDLILWVMVVAVLVPIAVLAAECMLAAMPRRRPRAAPESTVPAVPSNGAAEAPPPGLHARPRIAVLIPAHNEEDVIAGCLSSLMPQLHEHDRVLVIADNCNDTTAAIARTYGAQVRERTDTVNRGKGYALDFGLCCLAEDAPEVVVMVDADCIVHAGALERVARAAIAAGRPVQGLYLIEQPELSHPRHLVSALAVLVKNLVRPSGLGRIGMPCLLMGSGMAFPWHVIRRASLGSGNIVEDMKLGLDLLIAGQSPLFVPDALITGSLPGDGAAAKTQRTRWEQGHLRTLSRLVPRLVRIGVRQRRAEVLAIAADLCVPPLSLLVMLWIGTLLITVAAATTSGASPWPAVSLVGAGCVMAVAMLAAWFRYGRSRLPLSALWAVPGYVLWKIPIYIGLLIKPQRTWVRTERAPVAEQANG